MELGVEVRETGDGTSEVVGRSVVIVSGKLATLGGRLMNEISERLLDQFVANVESKFAARAPGSEVEAPASGSPQAPTHAPPTGKDLDALALIVGAIWGWLKGLFGAKGRAG